MATDPFDFLKALSPSAREAFEAQTERVTLPAGHTLFRQGMPPEAMYLVVAGTLGVYVTGPERERQLIALVQTGETIGEMAVVAGTPRSATAVAIRDCELLRLSRARFDRLLKHEPALMAGISRILVHRLRQVSRGSSTRLEPRTAAVLPVDGAIAAEPIAARLRDALAEDGYSARLVGPEDRDRPGAWFSEQEAAHDHLFLWADPAAEPEEWVRQCVRQADRILIVARAGGAVRSALPDDLLRQRGDHQLLDLVLLHESGDAPPSGSAQWLDLLPVNRHFHIRETEPGDWRRLGRIVGGRAVGVVLSGGGARAYAHIGALEAIRDAGIDIDFIGGVSMGGIIAAGFAAGWSPNQLGKNMHAAFVETNPLSDLTLPLISLFRGRKVERLLKTYFGELEIPDLWLPFYCVSSNLSAGELYVHRKGPVREALRASVALPGVLPPKVLGDDVLVDGAVINNLPVDVMRGLHRGPIIAIDVSRDRALTPEMLALTQRRSWLQLLRNPPIVSILMRAGTVSSEAEIERQAGNADLLVEPELGDVDIRDWAAFDKTVTIGYEHTAKLIADSMDSLRRRRRAPVE